MELHNLKPAKGSTHHDKRIGRGAGSGHGGTATRGHKGAQSRSGYSRKLGFEGGQMPLQRRVPKFGFTNLKRVEFKAINLSTLEELAAKKSLTEVTVDTKPRYEMHFREPGRLVRGDRPGSHIHLPRRLDAENRRIRGGSA